MKFSELTEEQWTENGIYFDTCVLPLTGLSGRENPIATTAALERLADVIDLVELPFKGRVVIYPACHYPGDKQTLEGLCKELKDGEAGFKHVFVVSAAHREDLPSEHADLIIMPDKDGNLPSAATVREQVMQRWTRK